MTRLDTLRSLQQRILSIFDRTMRVTLVDGKGGHIMWGMAWGMLLSPDVPIFVIEMMFIGGFSGMIYCIIVERSDD